MNKTDVDNFLRHPFVLAVAGTIIGTALIPWIVGQAQKRATWQEERIK